MLTAHTDLAAQQEHRLRTESRMNSPIPGFMNTRIIALALMMSGLIYLVPLIVFDIPGDPETTFIVPLGALALSSAVLSVLLPRFMKPTSEASAGLQGAVAAFQTRKFVQLAICESIFLYGFVAAYMAHDLRLYVPFGVVGALMMLIHFPRQSVLEVSLSDQALIELSSLVQGGPR